MTRQALMFSLILAAGCSATPEDAGTGREGALAGESDSQPRKLDRTSAEAADRVAHESLAQVRELIGNGSSGNYELSEAIPVYAASVDALKRYAGGPTDTVLAYQAERLYSITEGTTVVGSLTLKLIGDSWQVVSVGEGAASGHLVKERARLRSTAAVDGNEVGLLQVPEQKKFFLVHREAREAWLTSLDGENQRPKALAAVARELSNVAVAPALEQPARR